ncbi:DUF6177 family protein [Nocardiopsis alba]|uniref:DUF6177 family protein n=1 Tax=Nocardiopsis alba TaxID=53437 RepID=UPI0033C5F9D8
MSYDVVALHADNPDLRTLTRALEDAGRDLRVRALAGGHLLRLRDASGALLTLEPAQLIEAPGEVERLLDPDLAAGLPERCWWTEIRARPDEAGREAAHRVADRLALSSGGAVWTSGPADFGVWEETEHPAVEYTAGKAVVVAQDRPVVPFSSWISDVLADPAVQEHGFQLLTPARSRLTYALRTLMALPLARWVVRTEEGDHFDGLTGLPLRPHPEHGHVPVYSEGPVSPAEGFLDESPPGRQLVVDFTTRAPKEAFDPGLSVERVTERLAGAAPMAWGPYEPALVPWNRERMARLARHRAPRPSLFRFRGTGAGGSRFSGDLRLTWEEGIVREQVSLVLGHPDAESVPHHALPAAVAAVAEGLEMMHVRLARGREDATYAPRWHGLAEPLGFAVGWERAEGSHGRGGPLEGTRLGEGSGAVWYPVPRDVPRERATSLVASQIEYLTAGRGRSGGERPGHLT